MSNARERGGANACAYCCTNAPACCQHDEEGAYVCTRPKGHSGLCVACDDVDNHEISTWEAERVHVLPR